ncbi:M48 family metalloprotease [Bacteroidia bacterium]|nr:M48 family metalloprotease [Bacteroidia bacterium]
MLLKNTYRLDQETHQDLYSIAAEVNKILGLDAEVTLYQDYNSVQLNAGISCIGKEAHIVLSGNLINLLSEDEMKALLAHELSHYLFNKLENEDFEITQRIILA